jgi:hypothetical protein
MMARRGAFTLLAIACVIDAACRTPGPPLMPASPTASTVAEPIAEPLIRSLRQKRTSRSHSRSSYRPVVLSLHGYIPNFMAAFFPRCGSRSLAMVGAYLGNNH